MLNEDDYELIESIKKNVVKGVEKAYDIADSVSENSTTLDAIQGSLSQLLHEVRKMGLQLKKIEKKEYNKTRPPIDYDNLVNKNILIVRDNENEAFKIALQIAKKADKILFEKDTTSVAKLSGFLTSLNLNDYVFINYDLLNRRQKDLLKGCVSEDIISVEVGNNTMTVQIKPINYIMYTDTIELFDKELLENFEILD